MCIKKTYAHGTSCIGKFVWPCPLPNGCSSWWSHDYKSWSLRTSFSEVPQMWQVLHSMHCQRYVFTTAAKLLENCMQEGWPVERRWSCAKYHVSPSLPLFPYYQYFTYLDKYFLLYSTLQTTQSRKLSCKECIYIKCERLS